MIEPLRRVTATRYVAALREGGSLPGLVEADDDGMYVTKFRGAGQGEGALVAEVVAAQLGQALGLPIPDVVVIDVAPQLGHAEPDREIQELIEASPGPNLGIDFLPGALPFALPPDPPVDPDFAADVVWFDALVTNVDRTHRNPNLIVWGGRTWLIDHGAAFFRQHGGGTLAETAHHEVPMLDEHVLLALAGSLHEADGRLAQRAVAQYDYLDLRAHVDEARLAALAPDLDSEAVRSRVAALTGVARGDAHAGALAQLPPSERFGWLVAPSSTIIQPSEVHTGLTDEPAASLDRLLRSLVR